MVIDTSDKKVMAAGLTVLIVIGGLILYLLMFPRTTTYGPVAVQQPTYQQQPAYQAPMQRAPQCAAGSSWNPAFQTCIGDGTDNNYRDKQGNSIGPNPTILPPGGPYSVRTEHPLVGGQRCFHPSGGPTDAYGNNGWCK